MDFQVIFMFASISQDHPSIKIRLISTRHYKETYLWAKHKKSSSVCFPKLVASTYGLLGYLSVFLSQQQYHLHQDRTNKMWLWTNRRRVYETCSYPTLNQPQYHIIQFVVVNLGYLNDRLKIYHFIQTGGCLWKYVLLAWPLVHIIYFQSCIICTHSLCKDTYS